MLSLNTVSITSSDSQILDEIYTKLNVTSIEYDIKNMHSYADDGKKFLSLFFDGSDPKYVDFLIDWAYVESCVKSEEGILVKVYSYNGNLSIWTTELEKKYKNMYLNPPFIPKLVDIKVSLFVEKSVKFKNYEIENDWIEAEAPEPIINKK
jgi:hypothetical protein